MAGHLMDRMSYEPLTPTAFLLRTALVYGGRTAVVDGSQRFTYDQLLSRCARLAGALLREPPPGPVAVLSPNTHVLLEAHFGVPWSGRPLVTLNTRLTPQDLAWIIEHCGATTLLYDHRLADQAHAAAGALSRPMSLVRCGGEADEYEPFLTSAEPAELAGPSDERDVISINYTSGTTGRPKGVLYHHRGAYLQSLAMLWHARLSASDTYLWTLPMFHCNGWSFPWAVTAAGATHVCLAAVDASHIWELIKTEGVTALCGAPTVLTALAHSPHASARPAGTPLRVLTGGAPPTPALLARMTELNIDVTHLYGLTETFGPAVVCEWQPGWEGADGPATARLKARQGVGNVVSNPIRVVDPSGDDVPLDAATIGEIALRGNNVMLGYLNDPAATQAAAPDGWFRTGDLAVRHQDGYVEIKDRSKDVIISGGENISSVEVENVIAEHPSVLEVAVVAVPDDHWGEVPAAYVSLRENAAVSEAEVIQFARSRMAHFKAPKYVIFGPLPKTSTGKIQKFQLRSRARSQPPSPGEHGVDPSWPMKVRKWHT
jgi:fatty-acyl-CoA synthase